jgi:hypothetical protein
MGGLASKISQQFKFTTNESNMDSIDFGDLVGQEVAITRPRLASISTLSHDHKYGELHDFITPGHFYIKGKLSYVPLSMSQRVFTHQRIVDHCGESALEYIFKRQTVMIEAIETTPELKHMKSIDMIIDTIADMLAASQFYRFIKRENLVFYGETQISYIFTVSL